MKIGEFLKKKRLEKNISLRQLSQKIKLSHTNIADIEKGNVKKEISILKIISALGLTNYDRDIALKLMIEENTPKNLADDVLNLKKSLIIQNNSNQGDIVVGESTKNYFNDSGIDLSGLDKEDIEDIKKYIDFIRSKKKKG